MSGMIVSVVDSMSLFSIFTRCNNFLCCFFKMRAVFVFVFLSVVVCSHQSEGHQFVGVVCIFVISIDVRPYFTDIAPYIISSTNTTQNFTIA